LFVFIVRKHYEPRPTI